MIRIFVDFDGTITRGDVGDALFERFGGDRAAAAVAAYRDGRLSAADCYREESSACGAVSAEALAEFLDSREIDPTFAPFDAWCRGRSYALTILSDGMDLYIRAILDRHGLAHVPFRANRLELEPADGPGLVRFRPSFPDRDEVCDRCACCKRNHMLAAAADDDTIVYVGEGYSDRCPVQFADVVFAKDDLLRHCERSSIPFHRYDSFDDVRSRLERLTGAGGSGGGALPRRRRAAVARQDVYLGG